MDLHVYESVSYRDFQLDHFIKKYEFDKYQEEDNYDFSPLQDLDAILLEEVFVKDEFQGKGYGTQFCEDLKKIGKPIVLYSLFEATDFWETQGFTNLFSYVFIWYPYKG